jgi:hypothetical protein
MSADLHWSMVEPSTAQYSSATITQNNLTAEQVQSIENTNNPEDLAQENDNEPVDLGVPVPDIDDYTESLDLNDLAVEEVPELHI